MQATATGLLNLADLPLEQSIDEPGFRVRFAPLKEALGACLLGATVYEIEPGQRGTPYHVHHANEELLLVLQGSVDVRTPGGDLRLGGGHVLAFPRGPAGAHQVVNRSAEPCRYLVVSTTIRPEVATFPDTGKVYVEAGSDGSDLSLMLDMGATRRWLADEPR